MIHTISNTRQKVYDMINRYRPRRNDNLSDVIAQKETKILHLGCHCADSQSDGSLQF